MKILKVRGDDDYGVSVFLDSDYTKEQAVKDCESAGGSLYKEIDGQNIYFEVREFPKVSQKFIDFLHSEKDYDDTKHSDWFELDN